MRRFVGIILNAKYRVEKDHKDIGVIIPLDDEEKPADNDNSGLYY
ncbi:Putative replication protein (plasmid) [Lactiplantibacillus plantarum ZJ316]|nr:Putative replication protein [Lactiplantibacillus plantarum ZJ316]